MAITLARVDDRVIHGQTTTRWSKERPVDGILVVGDEIVNDQLRRRVLKAAARNLKLGIYGVDQAAEKIKLGVESSNDFFLICSSPQTFSELLKRDVYFGEELNVGPMNTRDGAVVIGRTLAIDQNDFDAFEYIQSKGIKISFQLLPDDDKKSWDDVKMKYKELTK